MDIHQLKTFVAVAREGSITRASERLHLSQPAVSAHIKAVEEALGLTLFERNARGMSLTHHGQRLLDKAEQTLSAHRNLMDEASQLKGRLSGKLRLGAGSNSNHEAVGKLLMRFSERYPEVEVTLKHAASHEVLAGLRNGSLDAGFYNEAAEPDPDLGTIEVSQFGIYVVSAPDLVVASEAPDWKALGAFSWIYPSASACCGRSAESLFRAHDFLPTRVISVDREAVTLTLVAGGVGVGLLHGPTAEAGQARGQVQLLFRAPTRVRVLFAFLARRAEEPLLAAAAALVREQQ